MAWLFTSCLVLFPLAFWNPQISFANGSMLSDKLSSGSVSTTIRTITSFAHSFTKRYVIFIFPLNIFDVAFKLALNLRVFYEVTVKIVYNQLWSRRSKLLMFICCRPRCPQGVHSRGPLALHDEAHCTVARMDFKDYNRSCFMWSISRLNMSALVIPANLLIQPVIDP